MSLHRIVERCGLVVALVAAGLTLQPVFADPVFGRAVWAASVLPVGLLTALCWKLPGRPGVRLGASAAAFVVTIGLTALPSTTLAVLPTPATLGGIWDGWVNGTARILTTGIPTLGDRPALVLAVSVVWLAAHVATEISLRTRSPVAPALPVVLLVAAGLVLSAGGGQDVLRGAVTAAGLLVLVLVRAVDPPTPDRVGGPSTKLVVDLDAPEDGGPAPDEGRGATQRLLLGAAMITGCTLAALLVVPTAAGELDDPYDPRDPVEIPLDERADLNPLLQTSTYLGREDPEDLFTVEVDGQPQNWRLVVLDRFDGTLWTASQSSYETAGGELTPADGRSASGPVMEITQRVSLDQYEGLWLPAADRPSELRTTDGLDAQVDPITGALIRTSGAADPGDGFEVVSRVPDFSDEALRSVSATTDPALLELAELPTPEGPRSTETVAVLTETAREATAEAGTAFEAVALLQAFFTDSFDFDTDVPPGHSWGNLNHFVTDSQQGSAEQFAAAFAVMARSIGYPARVAVGFLPGAQQADGRFLVRSDHAHAWPEVYLEPLGWVAFEPNPERLAASAAEIARTVAEEQEDQTTPTTVPAGAGGSSESTDEEAASSGSPLALVGLGLAAIAVCIVGFLVARLAVWHRRRHARRSAADPRDRTIGAYAEVLDTARRAGLRQTRTSTSTETARRAAQLWGSEAGGAVGAVAPLADRALFSSSPITTSDTDRAWEAVRAFARAVREARPVGERLRRMFMRPA